MEMTFNALPSIVIVIGLIAVVGGLFILINDSLYTDVCNVAAPTPTPTPTPVPPTELDNCTEIDTPGDYVLSGFMFEETEGNNCFNITADNVSLDCNGSVILGPGGPFAGSGIAVTANNALVYNCTIAQFNSGIYNVGNNSNFSTNWLGYNQFGMFVGGSDNLSIETNDMYYNFMSGLMGMDMNNSNLLTNDISYNGDGITFYGANGNILYMNDFINNTYSGVWFNDVSSDNVISLGDFEDNMYGMEFSGASVTNIVYNNTLTSGRFDFLCDDEYNQTDSDGNICFTQSGCIEPPGPAGWLTSCPPPT